MLIDPISFEGLVGERIDFALADYFEDLSRSKISRAIKEGEVLVNGTSVKPSYAVKEGDRLEINLDFFRRPPILPEDLPLDILYEDEDLLVINKSRGLIVHPTDSVRSGTLVNALLAYGCPLSDINGPDRPGIVHRLDADTTGAIIIAKNNRAHRVLQEDFRNRKVDKYYLAVVEGRFDQKDYLIDAPIGRNPDQRKMMQVRPDGKEARSYLTALSAGEKHSLLSIRIETGRTHQIRVHCQSLRHPVVGDSLYGFKKQTVQTMGQLLHAYRIVFKHPSRKLTLDLTAPLPKDFIEQIRKLHLVGPQGLSESFIKGECLVIKNDQL